MKYHDKKLSGFQVIPKTGVFLIHSAVPPYIQHATQSVLAKDERLSRLDDKQRTFIDTMNSTITELGESYAEVAVRNRQLNTLIEIEKNSVHGMTREKTLAF